MGGSLSGGFSFRSHLFEFVHDEDEADKVDADHAWDGSGKQVDEGRAGRQPARMRTHVRPRLSRAQNEHRDEDKQEGHAARVQEVEFDVRSAGVVAAHL